MLRDLGGGVWTVDMALEPLGLTLGARMTLLGLDDGKLVLHSPVACPPETARAISGVGEVAFIVAPNLIHYKYLPEAQARFPKARVLAPPGLREKRPQLPIDGILETGSGQLPGLHVTMIRGAPKLNEMLFLHRASKSLVAADFVFHYPEPKGWIFRFYLSLTRSVGVPAQTLIQRNYVKDRVAMRQTRAELLALDFDRLLMAHGEPILTGGKQALETAMAWL